jgi:hypothetical protein
MDFLKWYKNTVESSDLEPPENTWENIQDQLDIDNSWQVIDNYLNKRDRFVARVRIAAAASLIVVAVTAGGYIYFTSIHPGKQQVAGDTTPVGRPDNEAGITAEDVLPQQQESRDIIPQQQEAQNIIQQQQEVQPRVIVEEEPALTGDEELTQLHEIPVAEIDNEIIKEAIEAPREIGYIDHIAERHEPEIRELKIVYPDLTARPHADEMNITVNVDSNQYNEIESKRQAFKKLYVGTTGQLANTWLVNHKTVNGFKSTSLVSTDATFGSNLGVYAGTNLFNNLDLQLDLNFLSQRNQGYHEYLNGHYVSNKLKFNYSQLALSLRYYRISSRSLQGEHGINFGGYFAYLHNAYQKIGDETLYLIDSYNRMDYGLLLGYEYVFPLYGQLGLGTGFRAYWGLNNIYSGDGNIPDYLNVTHTASVNITLSLKYLVR